MNILDLQEIERIINEITSGKNLARKRNEYISYEAGSGLLGKYVQEKVRRMYPKTWSTYTIAEYSLVKKVVDKKARAYKEPPIRKLEDDNETKLFTEFLKENRFNDAMKDMDRIYNQHKYAGLYMELDEATKNVSFYPLRPYEFDVVKNDEGEVVCLILSYPGASITAGTQDSVISGDRADDDLNETEYVFWTNDNHLVVKVKSDSKSKSRSFEMQEMEGNPGNVNPYGKIPFAYLPFDFNEDYPSPSPLTNQTVELNSLLSVYLTSANMQVGQLVLTFPADQKIETVSQGMMTAISLPQSKNTEDKPSTASYISPAPNMSGHLEAVKAYLSMILDEQGINSAQAISGAEKFSSGLDRLLSQSDVQAIVEDNQDFYVRFEQECFEIINAMTGDEYKSTNLQVIFKKPKMLTSDTEKLANIEKMLELELIEPWEKFIEVDPNLSVEQAKEKLARINAAKVAKLSNVVNDSMNGEM